MTIKKKNLHFLQIQKFLKNYKWIIFLQHNNLGVKNWSKLRIELKSQQSEILLFKNTIMKNSLATYFLKKNSGLIDSINFLFQGPSFACGCNNLVEMQNILNILKSTENILVIGGIYSNQIVNHLDLEKLIKLDDSIYPKFLNIFSQKNDLDTILNSSINLNILNQVQSNFLFCLTQLQYNLKNSDLYIIY